MNLEAKNRLDENIEKGIKERMKKMSISICTQKRMVK